MSTLLQILTGFIVYSLFATLLRARGIPPEYVRTQGPLTTVHTHRGHELPDRIAAPGRFQRAWSDIGLGIVLVVMVGTFALLVFQVVVILQNPPALTQMNQSQNFFAISSASNLLPPSAAPEILFGLLIDLVVHEGDHGVFGRVKGTDVESMGVVLLTILPVGTFVGPSKESQRRTGRDGKSRMFAAGVTNNFAITLATSTLLFGPIIGSISIVPGVVVSGAHTGSPIDAAGISGGDRVTAAGGMPVNTAQELDTALLATGVGTISAELDGERAVSVARELVVADSTAGNLADLTIGPGSDPTRVTAVNGIAVSTRAGFESAVDDSRFARLDTSTDECTIPVGVYITSVAENDPLCNATRTARPFIVSLFNDEHITPSTELQAALDQTDPDQTVVVELCRNDSFGTVQAILDENPRGGDGLLGVSIFRGAGGLLPTDFDAQRYPVGTYLSLLGGDGGGGGGFGSTFAGSPLQLVYVSLLLPLTPIVPGISDFPSFTGEIINFYQAGGPLGFLDDGVFIFANVLF